MPQLTDLCSAATAASPRYADGADWGTWAASLARAASVASHVRASLMPPNHRAEKMTPSTSMDPNQQKMMLIMPLVFFLAPNDPRMVGTLDAINRSPREGGLVSDSLVFRYATESPIDGIAAGVDRSEGTFNLCTFWLVEALTRAGRVRPDMLDEARLMFERMMGYANHLGLFSEEIGPNGEALGNFPQAFTHLALISSAYNLDRALK